MRLSQAITTVLLVLLCLGITAAKKGGKKGGQKLAQAPKWKSGSHPGKDERFESEHEGKTVRLDCRAKGTPEPKVTWFKDGQKLDKGSDRVDINKFKLSLNSLVAEDKGNYTCVVSNSEGSLEWTFFVDVIVRIWPLLVEGPENATATTGDTVRFRCRVLNDPDATIRWLKPKAPTALDGSSSAVSSPFAGKPEFLENPGNPEVLELANVKPDDAGEYRCMAGNVWGLKYSSGYLTIESPTTTTVAATTKTTPTTTKTTTTRTTATTAPQWMFPTQRNPATHFPVHTFGPDLYETTRTPRNNKKNKNGNRGKDGRRKKGKKDKKTTTTTEATNAIETDFGNSFGEGNIYGNAGGNSYGNVDTGIGYGNSENNYGKADTGAGLTNAPPHPSDHSTTIWNFYDGADRDDTEMTYGEPSLEGGDEKHGETGTEGVGETTGYISLWTIYTIVGAVAGVVLLIGLLAITIAVCCRRDGGSVYKSTPV